MDWDRESNKKRTAAIPLEKFFRFVDIFYLSIGMKEYYLEPKGAPEKKSTAKWRRAFLSYLFKFQMVHLILFLFSELLYVIFALGNGTNFLETTMTLSYIGYAVIGLLKIRHIRNNRHHITKLVQRLQDLHPISAETQSLYKTDDYLSSYKRISIFYLSVSLITLWSYNLYWAVYYLVYDFWLGIREFERILPYYCWTPWDWKNNWSYYIMYIQQNLGGQTIFSGQLAADLLLCALVTLLVMHFKCLSAQIEKHVAGVLRSDQDLAFMHTTVVYHQHLLSLSDALNDIFGVPLFFNLASSSVGLCFVIFQITLGGKMDSIVMLMIFIFCSMVQMFMFGSLSQRLLSSSEHVGQSVYNHDWFLSDLGYRKLMLIIMQRAQRPNYLKATNLINVSLIRVTDLLQLSYKFSALLRTMYAQ